MPPSVLVILINRKNYFKFIHSTVMGFITNKCKHSNSTMPAQDIDKPAFTGNEVKNWFFI